MELLDYGYWGLFLAAFLAATVIPFSSDAVLAVMVVNGFDPIYCVTFASIGNWLGGMSSYFLGYLGKWQWLSKYMGMKREKVEEWQTRIVRYGATAALLTWLPIIGDLLAVALGFFRVGIAKVAVLMLVGKTVRYVIIALLALGVWGS